MRILIFLLSALFLVLPTSLTAQNQLNEEAEGWVKIYQFTDPTKPTVVDHRTYSINHLKRANQWLYWMQASYYPTYSVGDAQKMASEKLSPYNQHTKSLPQTYGAFTKTFTSLKKDASGTIVPFDNTHYGWSILANQTIGHHVEMLTTSEEYYFYIQHYGYDKMDETLDPYAKSTYELYGFDKHPNLAPYPHFYMAKNSMLGTGLRYVVILTKDHQLPFLALTKGEFIQKLEQRLPRWNEEEKAAIQERYSNDPSHIDLELRNLVEKMDRATQNFNKLKEKYKNRSEELAEVTPGNIGIQNLTSSTSDDSWDIFLPRGTAMFPVLKQNPVLAEGAKSDIPQWVIVSWGAEGAINSVPAGLHLHRSIMDNFNFDYLYKSVFEPEKIKGISYTPLKDPKAKEAVVLQEKSEKATETASESGVLYFEDFSQYPLGKNAGSWKSTYNGQGNLPIIQEPRKKDEHWIEIMGHNRVFPADLKMPLPENFEVSFDLAVPKDIPWGAKAFELYLGTKGDYQENTPSFKMRIRAGFWGRPGELTLEGKFGGDYFTSVQPSYEAFGFSNDKDFNTVTVKLRKSGESLTGTLDGKPIFIIGKAIPSGTVFNYLDFNHLSSDGENQKYFLSNLKIVKLE